MSTSKVGIVGDGEGLGSRTEGEYSLEHVEGIRNEGQRSNGVPYLWKVDILCQ